MSSIQRVYNALSYLKEQLKTPKYKFLDNDSAEFDWALNDLIVEAIEKFQLGDEETDWLNSEIDDYFEYWVGPETEES